MSNRQQYPGLRQLLLRFIGEGIDTTAALVEATGSTSLRVRVQLAALKQQGLVTSMPLENAGKFDRRHRWTEPGREDRA